MKRLFIHCGLPKCGSTSLQTFLSNNEKILSRQGFSYPMIGRDASRIAHHNIIYEMTGSDRFDQALGTTEDVLNILSSAPDLILSSEGFVRIIANKKIFDCLTDFHAAAVSRNRHITYILLVRSIIPFIESSYVQALTAGTLDTPDVLIYARKRVQWFIELFSGLERLRRLSGSNSLATASIERRDSIAHFAALTDIDVTSATLPKRENSRVSLRAAAFLYRYRFEGAHSPQQCRRAVRRIRKHSASLLEDDTDNYHILPHNEATRLLDGVSSAVPDELREGLDISPIPEYEHATLSSISLTRGDAEYFDRLIAQKG